MNTPLARPAADAELLAITEPDALGTYLRSRRAALAEAAHGEAAGLALARTYSDLVDSVIRHILTLACTRAGRQATSAGCGGTPIAIVATGGYGRRELCLHSDIDITFIPNRDGDPAVDRILKEMFGLLMRVLIDANGMSVGYAYRLLEDLSGGALDHQTASGLLDARLITGSDRLFIQFENDYWSGFNPAEFVFTKVDERRRMRDKHGDTPRVVEPNLKEGAGGLRDFHAALWVTQALNSIPAARVRGDRALDVLVREAGVTADEAAQLRAAKEFLFRVRNVLHAVTGAERDQLVITRQEEVADRLGYTEPSASRRSGVDEPPAVERFMRDYYTHAAAIDRIAGRVMRQSEQRRLFLGIGLDCLDRKVVPANSALEYEDPVWMLWACELAQRYGLEFGDDLERVILELLATEPVVRDTQQAAELFTRILASPRGAYPILQRMADLGILGWLLPEVGDALNRITYDPSHDYTVGQHTLYVVRNLDHLRVADAREGPEDSREYRQIVADLLHPERLYLAALLHDAGKGVDDRPHAEVGAELAETVCARLGWSSEATDTVSALVRHHLLMAETSRLRDLNLEETIRDFVAVIGDMDLLNMLYLLTYADTRAVGAGVWTQVKGRFLQDLLHRAQRAIAEGEPEAFAADDGLMRTRRRLVKELSVENLPPDEVAEHIESMPATYLLNTPLDEIALHVGMVRRARRGEPTVDFRDERDATYTDVTICTLDEPRPGLLAKIAGVFYAADLEVHSAQVFTRVSCRDGDSAAEERIAIDKFFVDFRGRQLTPGKRSEVSSNLVAVLQGRAMVAELLAKRRKSGDTGAPVHDISVRNDLSDTYTVVEVSDADERSLLYRASAALSSLGWDIHSARATAMKGRYTGSFYLPGLKSTPEAEVRRRLAQQMPIAKPAAAATTVCAVR